MAAISSIFRLLFTLCFRRQRTVPTPNTTSTKPLTRFSYSSLRRATSSFSPSLRLGQGGFGSVFRGTLKQQPPDDDLSIAVKIMDSGSLQGEREFQNELYFGGKIDSERIVSVLGFCSAPKRRRMVLVYELLANGSLQDCLLNRKCSELMDWKIRFLIALNIAKGLEYLHHFCDPPIIHGDIKPSNILLDHNFSAKIGDFGLAKLKTLDFHPEIRGIRQNRFQIGKNEGNVGNQVAVEENRVEIEGNVGNEIANVDEIETDGVEFSPETETVVSPQILAAMASPIEMFGMSISSDNLYNIKSKEKQRKKQRKNDSTIQRKLRFWGISVDDGDKNVTRRAPREWWKEEYTEELTKNRNKKKRNQQETLSDDGGYIDTENRRKSSWSGSMDWWSDGDLRKTRRRRTSYDSGGFSTHSLRGTVCYIAPEYRIRGDLSEKCDVYSYGVVLLVLVSGRRPLEVTGSPMDDFKRANLVSWARELAKGGKLVDLVDQKIHSLDIKQAMLCINVALLCLQKSPSNRPTMREIVGILSGESGAPELPAEYCPAKHSQPRRKFL